MRREPADVGRRRVRPRPEAHPERARGEEDGVLRQKGTWTAPAAVPGRMLGRRVGAGVPAAVTVVLPGWMCLRERCRER